ncbi:MAG: beta-lactamase family protein [Candidatus Rokubacteria bacterium]|nr:beta-lactamase family protein [Candidatus Rokubacteria bacterium]
MRRISSLVACLVLVLSVAIAAWAEPLSSARPEDVGLSSERLARIGPVLKAEIERGKFPGAVALVARKGRVAYFEALGLRDKAAGAPMTKDAIFRIYSMTKPLASVAAMMLVEDGRIVLTDPVSKYLPEFSKRQVSVPKADSTFGRVTYTLVPAEREPTVQDLLRHTSGLVYGEITVNAPVKEAYAKAGVFQPQGLPFDARGVTPAEQVERLAKAPLAHQPGTVWEYSFATDVVGRVVEVASGMTLGQFLEKRLFAPLKMVDSGFSVPRDKMARLAQTAPDHPIKVIDVSAAPKNDSGGAGAVSTAMDYARFCQMLLNGGRLDGARVLSRATVSLMTSDHLAGISTPVTPGQLLLGTPGYTFGLGFAVRQGAGVAGVPGSAGEYMWAGFAGTYFWVDPKEELVGVFMTQAPSPERAYYRKLFKQLVYQAITD